MNNNHGHYRDNRTQMATGHVDWNQRPAPRNVYGDRPSTQPQLPQSQPTNPAWSYQQLYQQQNQQHSSNSSVFQGYSASPTSPGFPTMPTSVARSANVSPQTSPVQQPTYQWYPPSASAATTGHHAVGMPPPPSSPTVPVSIQTVPSNTTSTGSPPAIVQQQQPLQDMRFHIQQLAQEYLSVNERNIARLNTLREEIRSPKTFGPACDEFRDWLKDKRAYQPNIEPALMQCVSMVHEKRDFGLWSALCILELVNGHRLLLSEPSQKLVARFYNDVHLAATGQPPPLSSPAVSPGSPVTVVAPRSQTSPQSQPRQNTLDQYLRYAGPPRPSVITATSSIPAGYQQQQQPIHPVAPLQQVPVRQQHHAHPLQPPSAQQPAAPQKPPTQQHLTLLHQQLLQQQMSAQSISPRFRVSQPRPNIEALLQIARMNPYKYIHRVEYAIAPFRLQHKRVLSTKPFFVGPDAFRRLWIGLPPTVQSSPARRPLSYVLTSWKNGTHESKCEWPEKIGVQINNQTPTISRREKVRAGGNQDNVYQYRGKDRPVELGNYLKEGTNMLQIHQPECACSHWFSIIIFLRETEDMLKEKIMAKELEMGVGRAIINNLLGKNRTASDDDDIQVMQPVVRISLKCPISLKRIEIPVKGEKCKHPDCFDMASYLAITSENPQWKCPTCSEYIPPDTITRDAFMEKLLQELEKNVTEVEFSEDCDDYKIVKTEDTTDDYDANDDLSTESSTVCAESTMRSQPVSAKAEPNAGSSNVISLISDDEDEDEDAHQRTSSESHPTGAAENISSGNGGDLDGISNERNPKRARKDNESTSASDNVLEEILASITNGSA